jgi:hypothetical protein
MFVQKVKVFENSRLIKMRKRGLSSVISMLLIILLVFVSVGIVWNAISGIIKDKTEKSESCFGNFGKVEINSAYTCYNSKDSTTQFSIERRDIDLDSLFISISSGGQSHSIELFTTSTPIQGLTNYEGGDLIILPIKNSGSTYYLDMTHIAFSTKPTSIKIAPVIGGHQCEVIDTLNLIEDCEALI